MKPRSESTITNTCLTGGRPDEPAAVVLVSAGVGDVPGVAAAWAGCCAVDGDVAAAGGAAPAEAPSWLGAGDCTTWDAGVLWARPTTISGALASVSTLVPPTSEPIVRPNASMPITATAAAPGPGIANSARRGGFSTSLRASAKPLATGATAADPRSWMAAISRAMCVGNGPRRAPHSRQ